MGLACADLCKCCPLKRCGKTGKFYIFLSIPASFQTRRVSRQGRTLEERISDLRQKISSHSDVRASTRLSHEMRETPPLLQRNWSDAHDRVAARRRISKFRLSRPLISLRVLRVISQIARCNKSQMNILNKIITDNVNERCSLCFASTRALNHEELGDENCRLTARRMSPRGRLGVETQALCFWHQSNREDQKTSDAGSQYRRGRVGTL